MTLRNTSWTCLVIAGAMMLTACNGQNPFKRQSDPAKDYPTVTNPENVRAYDPNKKDEVVKDPDNTQKTCQKPFRVTYLTSSGDIAPDTLHFLESKLTRYEIEVINDYDDEAKIEVLNLPDGAEFVELKRPSKNVVNYQLSWNPRLGSNETEKMFDMKLSFKSVNFSTKCPNAIAPIEKDLFVQVTQDRPIVTVSNVPSSAIEIGKKVTLSVDIEDPASNESNPPLIQLVEFDPSSSTGEKVRLDGSNAVICPKAPKSIGPRKWRMNCRFDTELVTDLVKDPATGNIATASGSGRVLEANFVISFLSKRNGKLSVPASVNVPIWFKKTESADASTSANAAGDKK